MKFKATCITCLLPVGLVLGASSATALAAEMNAQIATVHVKILSYDENLNINLSKMSAEERLTATRSLMHKDIHRH